VYSEDDKSQKKIKKIKVGRKEWKNGKKSKMVREERR
jgi:hypothetical protein